jgi:hypothetical protein
MKIIVMAVACSLVLTTVTAAQEKPPTKSTAIAPALEIKVRRVWEDFKNKNKDALGAALADDLRVVEEGTDGFGDKKSDLATVDDLELISYTLKDFTVKALGPRAALVTYMPTMKVNTKARRQKQPASSAKSGLTRATTGRRSTFRKLTSRKRLRSERSRVSDAAVIGAPHRY